MSYYNQMNALQGRASAAKQKDWTRPVLDILDIEAAQHGLGRTNDQVFTHKST